MPARLGPPAVDCFVMFCYTQPAVDDPLAKLTIPGDSSKHHSRQSHTVLVEQNTICVVSIFLHDIPANARMTIPCLLSILIPGLRLKLLEHENIAQAGTNGWRQVSGVFNHSIIHVIYLANGQFTCIFGTG